MLRKVVVVGWRANILTSFRRRRYTSSGLGLFKPLLVQYKHQSRSKDFPEEKTWRCLEAMHEGCQVGDGDADINGV